MLVNVINPKLDPRNAAMLRLRTTLFGTGELDPAHVERMLQEVGFAEVRSLPSPSGAFFGLVAARRGAD